MTEIPADQARTKFAEVLNSVRWESQHVVITRHSQPAAVLVPVDWYERAKAALAEQDG